ncbi:hypothetical protein [Rhodococcus sp. OK302]|uniref:hypothetical protein n=1 Tax=Rhodococcus sp. OK302 TaxID=1882769 RepID=UPI000B93A982|nr:hypothetical protein [Rhodococcus sp. OK302]OYD67000.1 hypothetical protein BDB13_0501 [Rhodococcus sp. OK302]
MATDAEHGLLVRRVGTVGSWDSPEMTAYDNEDHLQRILASDPQYVPGVPEGSLTVRELSTTAGPADVCIVSPDGAITIVECKLASNSERRRMVIGQVLDYASAIWVGGVKSFREQWNRQHGEDLNQLSEAALEQLDNNITEGRIDLCLAVDRIDNDLKRLVEFLNRITRDEIAVTALQLTYSRHGDIEFLMPSTYGGEIAAAKARASGPATSWTAESFLDALGSESDRALAEKLFELLEGLGDRRGTHETLWFGNRPGGGIFLYPYGLRFAPIQLWINKAAQLMAYGTWNQYEMVRRHPGFAELAGLIGQDYQSVAKGFVVGDVDLDELWQVVLRCAVSINSSGG